MTLQSEQLRSSLQEELAALQHRFARLKADVTQAHSSDSAEQAQERENDEVLDVIGTETGSAIVAIQSALQRMDEGSYGLCERCGEPIATARLIAIPQTTLCIDCAS